MSSLYRCQPSPLPFEQSRGILKSPREDGRKRTRPTPIPSGGGWPRFLSFHVGESSSLHKVHFPASLLSCTGYLFGKVLVALFSVITVALFSVIAFFAKAAQWPCFRLSDGPLFSYHLHG